MHNWSRGRGLWVLVLRPLIVEFTSTSARCGLLHHVSRVHSDAASRAALPRLDSMIRRAGMRSGLGEFVRYGEERWVLGTIAGWAPFPLIQAVSWLLAVPEVLGAQGKQRRIELYESFGSSRLRALVVAWQRLASPRLEYAELCRIAAQGSKAIRCSIDELHEALEDGRVVGEGPTILVTAHFSHATLLAARLAGGQQSVAVVVAKVDEARRSWRQRRQCLRLAAIRSAVDRLSPTHPIEICEMTGSRLPIEVIRCLRQGGLAVILVDRPMAGTPAKLGAFTGWKAFPRALGPARLARRLGARLVVFSVTGSIQSRVRLAVSTPIPPPNCESEVGGVTERLFELLGQHIGNGINSYYDVVGTQRIWSESEGGWLERHDDA